MRRFYALTLALLVALAPAVAAEPKDPLSYPLRQYGLVLAVALLGGVASWVSKVRAGSVQAWNLMSLVGELCTSALAGLLCFWLCEWQGFNPLLTASLVGIAGHMGTRAITLGEQVLARKYGGALDSGSSSPTPPAS